MPLTLAAPAGEQSTGDAPGSGVVSPPTGTVKFLHSIVPTFNLTASKFAAQQGWTSVRT